jgi:EmrB/QacA subfamily drug resistance transporter
VSETVSAQIQRYLPWLVAVALFMENLDATIVNTAVPVMAEGLGVAPLALKAVMTSYTLSLAVFIPVSGWMADRFGTRKVFLQAVGVFALGSLLCGISVNVPMLVASRILQGMGGAMMTPVGRIALVRTFPRSELLRTMNYVIIPALIGPMIGPFLGGVIVHWLHWRVIFFINLPFALAGLWFVHRYMPDYRDEKARPLDKVGFLLFGAGIALLSYVLEVFGEHTWAAGKLSLMTAIALLLLAAYGWHASRAARPVLSLGLFGIRTFRLSVIGGFATRLGVGGMPFLLPLLYQIGLGYAPWQAGLLTMPTAGAAIVMKLSSRPILARFGHRNILISNTLFIGVIITFFTLIGPGAPVWAILALSFAQGFFMSLQFTSMNSLIYADVSDADASKASSLASTSQQLSFSFGVAFASLIAGWFLQGLDQSNPAEVVPALHAAFITMGAIVMLSSVTYWRLHGDDGNNVSNRPMRTPAGA